MFGQQFRWKVVVAGGDSGEQFEVIDQFDQFLVDVGGCENARGRGNIVYEEEVA